MMIYPPIADLVKKAGSRYSLVIETAKRARQISQGATVYAKSDSGKEISVAANEIYEGKLSAVSPSQLRQHRVSMEEVEEILSENREAEENEAEEDNQDEE